MIKKGDWVRLTVYQHGRVVDMETDYKVLEIDTGVTCQWVAVLEVPKGRRKSWRVNIEHLELTKRSLPDGWSTP